MAHFFANMSQNNPPSNEKVPNNTEPNKEAEEAEAWAERYRQAHELLFSKLPQNIKERVLLVQSDVTIMDRMVEVFIKDVVALAEAQDFKPIKKDKKEQPKDIDRPANPS